MMRRRLNKNNYLGKLASYDKRPEIEEEQVLDSNEFYAQQVQKPKSESRSIPQEKIATEKVAKEDSNDDVKIAKEPTKEEQAFLDVDEALDMMLMAVQKIDEQISNVETETKEEEEAVKRIKELMDTAISPYLADVFKEIEIFDK